MMSWGSLRLLREDICVAFRACVFYRWVEHPFAENMFIVKISLILLLLHCPDRECGVCKKLRAIGSSDGSSDLTRWPDT